MWESRRLIPRRRFIHDARIFVISGNTDTIFILYLSTLAALFYGKLKKKQEDVEKGYYLLSHTYEDQEKASYYGVFQQGEKRH